VRFVKYVSASAESSGVVDVGVGDSHVSPAVADMAAVKHLRLVRLGDGTFAGMKGRQPSNAGGSVSARSQTAEHVSTAAKPA
jgi:hypothetical protein